MRYLTRKALLIFVITITYSLNAFSQGNHRIHIIVYYLTCSPSLGSDQEVIVTDNKKNEITRLYGLGSAGAIRTYTYKTSDVPSSITLKHVLSGESVTIYQSDFHASWKSSDCRISASVTMSRLYSITPVKRISCIGNNDLEFTFSGYDASRDIIFDISPYPTSIGLTVNKPASSRLSLGFDEINRNDFKNKELYIRVKQQGGTYTEWVNGFFFLPIPNTTIVAHSNPSCSDSDDAMTVLSFPALPEGGNLNYLLTIKRYEQDLNDTNNTEDVISYEGKQYEFIDGFTRNEDSFAADIIEGGVSYKVINKEYIESLPEDIRGLLKLKAGLYQFEIRTNDGSLGSLCSNVSYFLIDPPAPLSLNLNPITIGSSSYHTKTNGGIGQVTITASGGGDGIKYKYKIGSGGTYQSFTGSTITINARNGDDIYLSNENDCEEVIQTVVFNEPEPLTVSISNSNSPTCHTNNESESALKQNGSITYATSGGFPNVSVTLQIKNGNSWDNTSHTASGNTFSGLSQGNYRVIVRDNYNDIKETASVEIIPPEVTASNPSAIDLPCYDNTTPVVIPDLSNHTAIQYKITSQSDASYSSFTNNSTELSANNYTFKISRASNQCYELVTSQINQPTTALTLDSVSSRPDTCFANNGSITLSISGGWSNNYPYYIDIKGPTNKSILIESGSITNIEQGGLLYGEYTATVYANSSQISNSKCSHTIKFTINTSNPLTGLGYEILRDESCIDKNNAQIRLTNYSLITETFDFSGGGTINNDIISGLSATPSSYTFQISENERRRCSRSITVDDIKLATNRISAVFDTTHTACAGGTTGTISITATNGLNATGQNLTSQYKFNLQGTDTIHQASNSYTFDGLTNSTTYNVSVTDEAGCTVKTTISLAHRSNPVKITTIGSTPQYCKGGKNGTLTVSGNSLTNEELYFYLENQTPVKYESGHYTFNDLPALTETYNIILEDQKIGCYDTLKHRVINLNRSPEIKYSIMDSVACDMATNGQLLLDRTQNYPGLFTEKLFNADNIEEQPNQISKSALTFDHLEWQNYTIRITDSTRCTTETTFLFPKLSNAIAIDRITPQKASCVLAANGALEVFAKGGKPKNSNEYVFVLTDDTDVHLNTITGTKARFSNLPVGNYYKVYVKDSENCQSASSQPYFILAKTDSLIITEITDKSNPACHAEASGSFVPQIINLDSQLIYSYNLTSIDHNVLNQNYIPGTTTFNNLPHGNYTLEIIASDKCRASYPGINLIQPDSAKIINEWNNYIRAKGDSTGRYEITLEKGNRAFEYKWLDADGQSLIHDTLIFHNPFDTTLIVNQQPAGSYTFMMRDSAGCKYFNNSEWYTHPVNLIEPTHSLGQTDDQTTHVSCNQFSDGEYRVSGFGGWGDTYLYSRDTVNLGWQRTGEFSNLTAGKYPLFIKDTAHVVYQSLFTINEPDTMTINVINQYRASCPTYNDGWVEAMVNNDPAYMDNLDYLIVSRSNDTLGLTNQTEDLYRFNHLTKGNYELFVKDNNGCFASDTFTINEPDTAILNLDYNYIRRKGDKTGWINGLITNGNEYFDYKWLASVNDTVMATGQTNGPISLADLVAGNYTLMVRDTAGCIYEDDVWMKRQVMIREPDQALSIDTILYQAVSCYQLSDGQLEIHGIGGWGDYTYQLDTDKNTDGNYLNLPAGSYQLTVTDSSGVTYSQNIEMIQPDQLLASLDTTKNINCFGGTDGYITLDITGGNLSYQVSVDQTHWFDNDSVPNLPIGTYSVYVRDTQNCATQVDNITLNQPTKISLLDSTIIKSRCSNNEGQIISSYTGGVLPYNYSWQKDSIGKASELITVQLPYTTPSIDSLYSSKYIVEVRDAHDCPMEFEFLLGDITDLSINSINIKDVSCWGYTDGQAKASVALGNPDYIYTWSEEVPYFKQDSAWGMATGTYDLLVRDQKKCAVFKQFTIGTPDSISYRIIDKTDPLCLGGNKGRITLEAHGGTPGYSYQWATGTTGPTITDVEPGQYTIGITDAHNCYNQFTFPFDYQRTLKPNIGPDTLICHYDELPLDAGNYNEFKWTSDDNFSSKQQQITLTEPDTYYLEVTDVDNCLGYDTLKLDVSYLAIDNLNIKDVTCNGFGDGEAVVSVTPANWKHTISWPDGSQLNTWPHLDGGDYMVTVTDPFGCQASRNFSIYEPDQLALNVNRLMEPFCFGVPNGVIDTEGTGGVADYRYNWLHGENDNKLTKLDTGTYVLDVYDANNCHIREVFDMRYQTTIYPQLGSDLNICEGNNAKLYPGPFEQYQWFHNDRETGNDTALVISEAGTYRVEVTDIDGCVGRDTMSLTLKSTDLTPEFLTATSIPAGDTLILVEVSQPKPQKIEWFFTGEYQIVEQGNYFCKVIFNEEGMREVTLNAHSYNCMAQARKTILVTPAGSGDDTVNPEEQAYAQLLKVKATPNPSDGYFNVLVELEEIAPVNIYLVSLGSGQIMEHHKRAGMENYNFDFNVAMPGPYVVVAESNGERRVIKVIIK